MINEANNKKGNVGIVTLYHNNYNFGGLLQAYALPKALEKYLGIKAEQIDYAPAEIEAIAKKPDNKSTSQYLYQQIYRFGIKFFGMITKNKLNQRKQAFDGFINEIPHSKSPYDCNSIHKCLSMYKSFICGGDQIWNDCEEKRNIYVYTLQFVPFGYKKISYSPSMAVPEASSDFKKIMSKGLNELDAVSVREKQSLSTLRPLTDNNIYVVVDPVLLMTENDWAQEAINPQKQRKYILCYLLGDSEGQRKAIKNFAKQLNLSVLTFPHILASAVRKCDLFFGDIRDYTSGPHEFLGLIKNAEFVITDSFHACVFSMIFKTPFAVFERNKNGKKGNMNSRIYDFLEEYHLQNQLVTEDQLAKMTEIPMIDYKYAHKHWAKRRDESLEYLKKALQND